jgi:Tfp pilus assembly protein PilV
VNTHGLTLVEVIVASVILVITVAAVLLVFITEEEAVARAGRRMQAIDFCRQTLEELRNSVGADTWPTNGLLATGGPYAHSLPLSELRDKFSGTRQYTVTDIDADIDGEIDYKSVTVTVTWQGP